MPDLTDFEKLELFASRKKGAKLLKHMFAALCELLDKLADHPEDEATKELTKSKISDICSYAPLLVEKDLHQLIDDATALIPATKKIVSELGLLRKD